jgi:hypothetical protein
MGRLAMVVGWLALVLAAVGHATPVAVAEPQLAVTAPASGATLPGQSFAVTFRVTDLQVVPTTVPVSEAGMRPEANRPGQGHLHFVLDSQPLVVWERLDPYTFTNVPPGEHLLMVELVQNDHGPLNPPVSQMIRFRSSGLLAGAGAGPALPAGAPLALLGVAALAGGLLRRRRR